MIAIAYGLFLVKIRQSSKNLSDEKASRYRNSARIMIIVVSSSSSSGGLQLCATWGPSFKSRPSRSSFSSSPGESRRCVQQHCVHACTKTVHSNCTGQADWCISWNLMHRLDWIMLGYRGRTECCVYIKLAINTRHYDWIEKRMKTKSADSAVFCRLSFPLCPSSIVTSRRWKL